MQTLDSVFGPAEFDAIGSLVEHQGKLFRLGGHFYKFHRLHGEKSQAAQIEWLGRDNNLVAEPTIPYQGTIVSFTLLDLARMGLLEWIENEISSHLEVRIAERSILKGARDGRTLTVRDISRYFDHVVTVYYSWDDDRRSVMCKQMTLARLIKELEYGWIRPVYDSEKIKITNK